MIAIATELATGYISIVAETSGIPRQVQAAFNGSQQIATRAGQQAGQGFSGGLMSGLKKVGPALGLAGGLAGLTAGLTSVVSTGNTFTNSMNTMRAVSQASAADMQKVSAAARQLANDTSLPATSATDAAAAMVELSKGGFSVEQSMTAARGTLQLAAAAQIDAATAATIQSQALQAFGKDASYAGQTADILANAANASSAEITDVAQALQQSGTVANQFGLSMQDTAAAIAMMANAGIQGSDAGTLLKSALLALTDQSNPAQGAIEELGLTVYDAQGKFVGLERLFGDLDKASKSMTAEQYQAATATLFGSDAMRLAGIAAEQGAEGYDRMVQAMGRQGSAAEVAAAKTAGLPGAWERLKNAVESASLSVYDVIKGPLTSAADGGADMINQLMAAAQDAGPKVMDFFRGVGDNISSAYQKLQASGKIEEWGARLSNIWNQIGEAASNVGPIILQFSQIAAKAAAAMGFAAWESLLAVLESVSTILNVAVVPVLQLVADVAGASEIATVALVAAFLLFKTVPAVIGSVTGALAPLTAQARAATAQMAGLAAANRAVIQTSTMGAVAMGRFGSAVAHVGQQAPVVARMQQSFVSAAAGANHFSRTAGVAAAAGTGLRAAGSSLAGVFGGPLGLGLTAAAVGGMAWMSSVQKQNAATKAYQETITGLIAQQKEMGSLLRKTNGAETQDVYSALGGQVDLLAQKFDKMSQSGATWGTVTADVVEDTFSIFTGGSDETTQKMNELEAQGKKAKDALAGLGLTSQDIGYKLAGGTQQWQTFIGQLRATGEGGQIAATELQKARDVFLQQQAAAKSITPGIDELQIAMQKFSDSTASAADKSNALKAALDALNPARTAQEAMSDYNDIVRTTADSLQQAADKSQGFGRELLAADGSINTATANGDALQESLKGIVDASADVASKGGDMNRVNAENARMFEQLATQYGVSVEEIRAAADTLGLSDIDLVVKTSGSSEVIQELASIDEAFSKVPGQKTIEVSAGSVTDATRAKLEELGFKVTSLPNGNVKVEATDGASPLLASIVNKVVEVGGMQALPKIDLNKTSFDLKDTEAHGQLENLRSQVVSPQAGLIIDKLLQGKAVSMAELQVLDQTQTNPKVDMAIDLIMQKLGIVNAEIDKAARPRNVVMSFQTDPNSTYATGSNYGGRGAAAELRGTGADGGFRAYASGGINNLPKSAMIQNPKADLVQWAEPETGGEAFIPLAPSKRSRSLEIWRKTGQLLGAKFQEFANGGIRAADFDELAEGGFGASRPLQGAPYDWAGVNWGDCSGAMSAFARFAAGLPIWAGRFATGNMASALQQMGAVMGRGTSGDLRFGWYNGGEGGGHTAGTLPSGKPVEMGGPHGGGAYGVGDGADGAAFTDHAYFPGSMFGPSWTDPGSDPGGFVTRPDGSIGPVGSGDYSASGSGGTAANQSPEQKIASSFSENLGNAASAFVKGQTSDALGVFGINDSPSWLAAISQYQQDNPPKEPSANERAQGARVTDPGTTLPKAGEDLGGVSPSQQAPALDFTPTGDAVKDAVKRAFSSSKWADGAPWDATDFIVGNESSWNPVARNASSGAFGLFQFMGSTKDQYLPDENSDPGVQGEAGEKYITDRYGDPLRAKEHWVNNGWYDDGGWLPTGQTLVTNNTGKPEPVFNPQQWEALKAGGGQTNDYSMHVINPVFRDESALLKSHTKHVSIQKMRFGG